MFTDTSERAVRSCGDTSWQGASQLMCPKAPLFGEVWSNKKSQKKISKISLRRATDVTFSTLRNWCQTKKNALHWRAVYLNSSGPNIVRYCLFQWYRLQRDILFEAVVLLRSVVTFVTWLISRTEFSSSELENSFLEINHVMKVTTVLSETTASNRVPRYYFLQHRRHVLELHDFLNLLPSDCQWLDHVTLGSILSACH